MFANFLFGCQAWYFHKDHFFPFLEVIFNVGHFPTTALKYYQSLTQQKTMTFAAWELITILPQLLCPHSLLNGAVLSVHVNM